MRLNTTVTEFKIIFSTGRHDTVKSCDSLFIIYVPIAVRIVQLVNCDMKFHTDLTVAIHSLYHMYQNLIQDF